MSRGEAIARMIEVVVATAMGQQMRSSMRSEVSGSEDRMAMEATVTKGKALLRIQLRGSGDKSTQF